ncbi:hypothetical protein COU60_01985 [Candidatus Pacearchaeota archaeon CG10_big_fil_rev_8_21_14_0_10_34_76]|nr:MAG: hypothetical protein COU60_01985 [Candidatus Pacearchaeota archaeon CG10_big_fil_rev_8_21_14_0_10_34_76]
MINQKKGLSDIVTNVLIILLVLVAVGIIWAFLNPTIRTGAGQLGGAADCLTVQLEPVSCDWQAGNQRVTFEVKRNAGSGSLKDIKLIVANGENLFSASSKLTGSSSEELQELATGRYIISSAVNMIGKSFTVAAVVDDGSGGMKTCSQSTIQVICTGTDI